MRQATGNWKIDRSDVTATGRGVVRQSRWLFVCLVLLLLANNSGCVQRRMLIRSQPEGAMVTIDRQAIGQTPVSVPFTYYGTREIQLEKEGYQTIQVRQRLRPPWYEVFPLSFFSNHFAMREVRDVRRLDFELIPKVQVSEYQLIERANQLRTDVGRGTVTAPIGK
ncbi:MAG: PEGA domain-containing protein [Planctomycetota bacterium]